MNDPHSSLAWPYGPGDDLPDRIWTHGDFTPVQEFPVVELTEGYTSGAFIKAALRRRVRFWCATAIVGMLLGLGLYVKFPPAYQATATVLLTNSPSESSATAMETEATLAQSVPVAESVVRQLKLQQSVASFMAASVVTVTTDQVLQVTVGAPSATAAVTRANALAETFLKFRATYLEIQQQDLMAELSQQQAQAQQRLNSINAQLKPLSAEPNSPVQQANLKKLQAAELDANNALGQVKSYVVGTAAASKTLTDSMVQDSRVIDPATLAEHSRLKGVSFDAAGGLIGGLALGIAIVVIGALVSDRLRRREDVAEAFGAPVALSVGALRGRRRLSGASRRARQRSLDLKRVVSHLRNTLPGSSRGPASLAVIAVDDARVAARAVAALAVSCAVEGKKVIVADLSGRAALATLLGIRDAGTQRVSWEGASFVVAIPEPEDVAPAGPLPGSTLSDGRAPVDKDLVAAAASADILVTLATLEPAVGSEYLSTWATDAVVMVTAGRSSEERVRGVRGMVRLAGMRLDSVVLVEADKQDQSLGAVSVWTEPASFGQL